MNFKVRLRRFASSALAFIVSAAAFCVLFSPAAASAGNITGKIASLHARASDGLIWVEISGTATGQPSCVTHSYFIIKSETSDIGKSQYAMLISAFLSGASVTIQGANTCTRWYDGEDIDTITLGQ